MRKRKKKRNGGQDPGVPLHTIWRVPIQTHSAHTRIQQYTHSKLQLSSSSSMYRRRRRGGGGKRRREDRSQDQLLCSIGARCVLTRGKENVLTLKSFISFLPPPPTPTPRPPTYSSPPTAEATTDQRYYLLLLHYTISTIYKILSIRLICAYCSTLWRCVASRPIFCRFFFFYYDDHFFLLLHRIGGWEICYFIPLWNNFFPSSKPLFFL